MRLPKMLGERIKRSVASFFINYALSDRSVVEDSIVESVRTREGVKSPKQGNKSHKVLCSTVPVSVSDIGILLVQQYMDTVLCSVL